jgi:hypothetical protein
MPVAERKDPYLSFRFLVEIHGLIVGGFSEVSSFSRDEKKRIKYEAMVLSSYLDYKETSDWLDREFLAKV